jgi:hypothetical protein
MRWTTLILAAAGVMAVAAMLVLRGGNSDDEARIRTVVHGYAAASAAGDGERLCALMTSESRDQFATTGAQLGNGCEGVMRGLDADLEDADRDAFRTLAVTRVVVDDSTAEVELSRFGDEAGGSLSLAKRGDRWLLDFEGPGTVEVVGEQAPETIGDRLFGSSTPPEG